MAEQVTLTIPITTPTTKYYVVGLTLERGYALVNGVVTILPERSYIQVILQPDYGERIVHSWSGVAADTDIKALNKANLTSTTLNARILTKLVTDGVIVGTVGGTAD